MEIENAQMEMKWDQVYNTIDCPINLKDGKINIKTAMKLVKKDISQGLGKKSIYFQTYGGGPEGGYIYNNFGPTYYYKDKSIMEVERKINNSGVWGTRWKVENIWEYNKNAIRFKIEDGILYINVNNEMKTI